MAILEPALVENLLTPFLLAIRDGGDEAVELDVPRDAAEDMLFGHMRTQLAMFFGWLDHPLADGAELAVEKGRAKALAEWWQELLKRAAVREHCEGTTSLE